MRKQQLFPFFEKKDSFCWQNRKSFIAIQLLSFSYMSQFGFVNISFTWPNLQKKQKWPFRSSCQCNSNFSWPARDLNPQPVVTRNIVFTSPTFYLLIYIGW